MRYMAFLNDLVVRFREYGSAGPYRQKGLRRVDHGI